MPPNTRASAIASIAAEKLRKDLVPDRTSDVTENAVLSPKIAARIYVLWRPFGEQVDWHGAGLQLWRSHEKQLTNLISGLARAKSEQRRCAHNLRAEQRQENGRTNESKSHVAFFRRNRICQISLPANEFASKLSFIRPLRDITTRPRFRRSSLLSEKLDEGQSCAGMHLRRRCNAMDNAAETP